MDSVIIVAPEDYGARFRACIPAKYQTTEGAHDALVIEDGRTRIYVAKNQAVRDELDAAHLAVVDASMATPIFYTVDFADIDFCRDILLAVVDDPEVLVDNDHG